MLHKVKRSVVGGLQARNEPKNAQFEATKQRLEGVEKSITTAVSSIEKVQRTWIPVADGAHEFSWALHSNYGFEDELRMPLKDALEETSALERFVKAERPDVVVLERVLRGYVTELRGLKSEYPKVEKARLNYAMASHKNDKLESKGAASDKKAKQLETLEGCRATYYSALDSSIHRMQTTLEKAPAMFRAAFIAYWLSQRDMYREVAARFEKAIEYADKNEHCIISDVTAAKTLAVEVEAIKLKEEEEEEVKSAE